MLSLHGDSSLAAYSMHLQALTRCKIEASFSHRKKGNSRGCIWSAWGGPRGMENSSSKLGFTTIAKVVFGEMVFRDLNFYHLRSPWTELWYLKLKIHQPNSKLRSCHFFLSLLHHQHIISSSLTGFSFPVSTLAYLDNEAPR